MKLRLLALVAIACPFVSVAGELLTVRMNGKELVGFQAEPLANPVGGDKFKGSNFVHPLKTPSGFVVTECQPEDHKHHFGLWWPWKFLQTGDRKINCWELQKGEGLVQVSEAKSTADGLIATSAYIDRKAPGGPAIVLNETTIISAGDIVDQPATGYVLDLEIVHQAAGGEPVTVVSYRYSGFSMRGTSLWDKGNSSVLTSEGKDRLTANFTRARWVRVQGKTDQGASAGVLLMSRPDNQAHPEKLRTWDTQENGAIYINFNTVMDTPWQFEPGNEYARHYRLFVYDGDVSATEADDLWNLYASTVGRSR